jgi:hypothetical protein
MIIVMEDTIPVACYDGVSPQEAILAYIGEFLALSTLSNIIINIDGGASLYWNGKKYDAVIYLETF